MLKSEQIRNNFWRLVAYAIVGGLAFAGLVYLYFSKTLPQVFSIADYRPLGVSQIVAYDGDTEVTIDEFSKEKRYVVPFDRIPKRLVHAFIAAEDDAFFEHAGIRPVAILRAMIANLRAGRYVQGGSTITQQVAKSLFLTPERSIIRKVKEAILANRLEENLTKEQILYLYMNQIYLGHGAYGVQAAAKTYFHKDVSEMTVAECALLAGMPQAPSKYSPIRNPKRAKDRQLYVLRRMYENDFITKEEMLEAALTRNVIYTRQFGHEPIGEYYVEHIRRYLMEKYGEQALYEDGLKVVIPTTPQNLRASKKAVQEGLREVDKRRGYRGPKKKLASGDEIDQYLAKLRENQVEKVVPFRIFLPEGRSSFVEALRQAKFTDDRMVFEVDKIIPAVVTSFSDDETSAFVMLGNVAAELKLDEMKWIYPIENIRQPRKEPTKVTEALAVGDVIEVRVKEIPEDEDEIIQVALEQDPEVEGSLLSLEARTGYVLAMEGGYSFYRSQFNRAAQAERQPGSAFKPFIYGLGIESLIFNPASIVVDSPVVVQDETMKWKPKNYGSKFYGDTTFRRALIKSMNIPTIKIVQKLGIDAVIEFARRLGFGGEFNKDLSIALGSSTVNLLELTKIYSIFPRRGRKVKPIFFTKIVDRDGQTLEEHVPEDLPGAEFIIARASQKDGLEAPKAKPEGLDALEEDGAAGDEGEDFAERLPSDDSETEVAKEKKEVRLPKFPIEEDPEQVVDPRVAYMMSHLLKEVVEYGTGRRARALGRPAAGKTGTTNDSKDAWFMGFTPHIVTGAWVGYDDSREMGSGETGGKSALPIWLEFMKDAVSRYPDSDFEVPPGIIYATIDSENGKLTEPDSPRARVEAFIEGTEPTERTLGEESGPVVEDASEFLKEDF
jgi:penicillin-binding protein 1A